jgi:DNA-binding NarL/FixJ family response regulator
MRNSYSVIIVDDHLLFAQALEKLVNTFDDFYVLYTVTSGSDLQLRLKREESIPDIALIDINMPVMNGIEITRWLTKHYPAVRVLALSMDNAEHTVISMLRAGARGYLLKDITSSALEEAFRAVIDKGFHHSEKTTRMVMNTWQRNDQQLPLLLKEREIEFLRLVCTEKTYKEIASEMFLSPKTVDGYRESLFEKLQIRSRVGLALYAIRNKIFKIE